jgi:signal transduction histidine kinase
VVFSITTVVLALAASQYSPNVLRNFMRDRTNQAVLGTFAGIYAYCLVVLRSIRTPHEGAEKHDIQTVLELPGDDLRLATAHEVLIFRAIQELMVNARDYASPEKLSVLLEMTNERVVVVVEDNGRGFDAEMAMASQEYQQQMDPRVRSIVTLKEKFELAGGSLAVNSTETEGTTVRIELPVNQGF